MNHNINIKFKQICDNQSTRYHKCFCHGKMINNLSIDSVFWSQRTCSMILTIKLPRKLFFQIFAFVGWFCLRRRGPYPIHDRSPFQLSVIWRIYTTGILRKNVHPPYFCALAFILPTLHRGSFVNERVFSWLAYRSKRSPQISVTHVWEIWPTAIFFHQTGLIVVVATIVGWWFEDKCWLYNIVTKLLMYCWGSYFDLIDFSEGWRDACQQG